MKLQYYMYGAAIHQFILLYICYNSFSIKANLKLRKNYEQLLALNTLYDNLSEFVNIPIRCDPLLIYLHLL